MSAQIHIGWAEADITPPHLPVALAGFFYARISEEVKDPLKATICAMEADGEQLIFVTCDLLHIPDSLGEAVRLKLRSASPDIEPLKVVINATHTHTGPEFDGSELPGANGIDLGIAPGSDYLSWLSGVLADSINQAWNSRKPGGVAFGLDFAVVGRNRRWVDFEGNATMYGLTPETIGRFQHVEGYEDHSLNLLATYDNQSKLIGLIVNITCPSQQERERHVISADFWHETRRELRKRFGDNLFVLPQCGSAGEITSILLYEKPAHARMLELLGRTTREEIACRITESVARILPSMASAIEKTPRLKHEFETLHLPANSLTQANLDHAKEQVEIHRKEYELEISRLRSYPELREKQRWYLPVTGAYRSMQWHNDIIFRYERQKSQSTLPAEVHVVRLGQIAFASNPFEYYLDFGIRIKVLSPAIQTFLIQLAGEGTYVPSARSTAGGGYGSSPASNPVGSDGGKVLADYTVRKLCDLFDEQG